MSKQRLMAVLEFIGFWLAVLMMWLVAQRSAR